MVKNMLANAGDAGDAGSIPVPARYPGEENGNPIQYSCLENSMEFESSNSMEFENSMKVRQRSLANYSPWSHTESDRILC